MFILFILVPFDLYSHNCGDPTDCYGTATSASGVAAGILAAIWAMFGGIFKKDDFNANDFKSVLDKHPWAELPFSKDWEDFSRTTRLNLGQSFIDEIMPFMPSNMLGGLLSWQREMSDLINDGLSGKPVSQERIDEVINQGYGNNILDQSWMGRKYKEYLQKHPSTLPSDNWPETKPFNPDEYPINDFELPKNESFWQKMRTRMGTKE